ncbi:MAG: Bacterial membrane flanked domain protein [Firmicutes bacterium ADurb.Bin354]|nr:MAG: Bacterial membrane flanked domain protein [Firmicutes bacterium ADurb.Bin354]
MAEFKERKRWLFLGLPWTFTIYTVKDDMITIDKGFLNKQQDDCYMYKVQDVELIRSFWERMVGLGTVRCFTGDTTDKELQIKHVRHAKEIKDFIFDASEKARIKRRTVNMLDIGNGVNVDADGMIDDN